MRKLFAILFVFFYVNSFAQNVGIGTVTPSMKLHVASTSDSVVLLENKTVLNTGITTSLYFKTGATGSFPYTGAIKTIGQSSSAARLGLFTNATFSPVNLLERLSITDGGNVGIGITAPTNPLSFPATIGKKISLYPGNSGDVGFGVYGNELRMYSDYNGSDITFGYDDNTNGFTENVRMKANGNVGIGVNPAFKLDVNGRMLLRNNGLTSGIWFNKANNTQSNFLGNFNDSVFGVYTTYGAGWQYFIDHKNGNVGIQNSAPHAPLSFESAVGNKIALWGDATGAHYGLGIQGALMQLYTSASTADIAFGYGKSDALTENVRFTGTGRVGIGINAPSEKLEIQTSQGEVGWKHSYGAGNSITCRAGLFGFLFATPATINSTGFALKINQGSNDGILLTTDGKILMGPLLTGATGYLLNVGGKIISEEVKVQLKSNWADYVFDKNYQLPSLSAVKNYIEANKHLPGIPAAAEIEKNGLELGDMQKRAMEKIEQLTLYIIDLQNQINTLKVMIKEKSN